MFCKAICNASFTEILSCFPPESRPATAAYLKAVFRTHIGTLHSSEQAGTVRSRRLFYLHFACTMNWTNDLLLEKQGEDRTRGQYQLAMFAIHLSTGHSLRCRTLHLDTIKQYVFAAASLLMCFSGIDFRRDNPFDKHFGHILSPVYDDIKKHDLLNAHWNGKKYQNRKSQAKLSQDSHKSEKTSNLKVV